MLSWPNKDPDEILDYVIDWTARLAGDTITSSIWTVPVGLIEVVANNTTMTTTIWLAGGTLDQTYELINRIGTTGGRTMDQTVRLRLKAK